MIPTTNETHEARALMHRHLQETPLVRGVGRAIKQAAPATRIVGVQAEPAPSSYLS